MKSTSSRRWSSSALIIGILALATFALVSGVLTAAQKKRDVVVAARALEAGTKLSLADVEVALAPGHRAVDIHVDQASGLAGLLRPGDTVFAIGIIEPTQMGGMATTHTARSVRISS